MSFGGRALPGPVNELKLPADSLAVAGRRCGNKGREKEDRGRQGKNEREAAHPQSFL